MSTAVVHKEKLYVPTVVDKLMVNTYIKKLVLGSQT